MNNILKFGYKKLGLIISAIFIMQMLVACMDDSYRVMKVYKVEGKTTVTSADIGDFEAYEGMVLESGDQVSVDEGNITLKVDEDKYLFAEKGTKFNVETSGSEDSGKIAINLTKGSVTSEIQNKLSADSTYEVNAPNSTMSVRGTIFSMSVRTDANGKKVSYLEVFNGTVDVNALNTNGTSASSYSVPAGKGLTIDTDDEGNVVSDGLRDADISSLTKETIEYLLSIDDEHGSTAVLEIGDVELEEYYEEHYEECYVYEEYEEIEEYEEDEEFEEIDEDSNIDDDEDFNIDEDEESGSDEESEEASEQDDEEEIVGEDNTDTTLDDFDEGQNNIEYQEEPDYEEEQTDDEVAEFDEE